VDNPSSGGPRRDDPRGADLAREALRAARAAAGERSGAAGRGQQRGQGGRRATSPRRRRWSGPAADDRDPQPLGRIAARLAAERGWTEGLSRGRVFAEWERLVGEDVAAHATPVALSGGELVVRAESTAWATQLRLLQRDLLAKLAAGLGDGVVRRLKIAGPAGPSWRHGPRHVSGRGPRDTYG
jgi:predicted nucleic acid-binding Zn ribbon protein